MRIDGVLLSNGVILGSVISGNISGNSTNVTGTVAVANGGTGRTDGAIVLAHGTVTQTGTITTTVTVNAPSGVITTVVPNIPALSSVTFTVNNSFVTTTSVVELTLEDSSGNLLPLVAIGGAPTNGTFVIKISNVTSNPFGSSLKIHFTIF